MKTTFIKSVYNYLRAERYIPHTPTTLLPQTPSQEVLEIPIAHVSFKIRLVNCVNRLRFINVHLFLPKNGRRFYLLKDCVVFNTYNV